jgi:peptide/nickel transport system substrate-binding protein
VEPTQGGSPGVTTAVTPSPTPARLLTICLGREPASLFYYDATSIAAQDVLAAVYDGPVDIQGYIPHPVILEKLPSLADRDAIIKPVEVSGGNLIVDSSGDPVTLEAGVTYRPSGCTEAACAQDYPGDGTVQMDQLVLRFKLLPGLQWSDGTQLISSDSVYSYEVARSLPSSAQPSVISRTESYTALDETTLEWVGVPGFQDGFYQAKFFTPLPQHAWSSYTVEELHTQEISARKPLGWGPYIIDEWVSGDHLSLHKNPLYFRAGEGLPHFDNLVFRFVSNGDEALDALLAGECDLVDRSVEFAPQSARLAELQKAGSVQVLYQDDAGWEQLAFGITPLDNQRLSFFTSREVRQAVAMCVDREALVANQPAGVALLLDSYTSPANPLYDPQVQHYAFDATEASGLLEAAGWLDPDENPLTPRVAQGVQGIPDGTLFEVEYLVSPDAGEQADAKAIQKSLQACGMRTRIVTKDAQEYLAPGPQGQVFGRAFDLAQFAWAPALEPPCYLYLTDQIPGAYPEYPRGWGGANASGYSNPQYDQACQDALYSLPDSAQHQAEHFQAQEIFSQDLPVLPLYSHYSVIVSRPDMCSFTATSAVDSALWNLEGLDYGTGCIH